MNNIFFAPDGYTGIKLTSSSANHIANLAKELIRNIESSLRDLCFYDETLTLVGSSDKSTIKVGMRTVYDIPSQLQIIAKAKSLIAWLREALKEKERISKEFSRNHRELYFKKFNIQEPKEPDYDEILTEEEYYNSLTIKERNRYYELETIAAIIGKAIHQDGTYAKAREELNNVINNPTVVKGNGRDTLIYNRTASIEPKEVEDVYFELQKAYREIQSELNSMKYKCTLAIEESQNAVYSKYNEEYANYRSEIKELNSKIADFYNQELSKISNFKIIIPNSLMDIYEQVSKLGK